MYRFLVDGIPKGQPRPRSRGKAPGVYDPGTADAWRACVKLAGREQRPEQPLDGPLEVAIWLHFPRPKRLMRKKDPAGTVVHTSKPDADNVAKAVLDALQEDGWFRDDCQVWSLVVKKHYHDKAGRPGALIEIEQEMAV